MSDRFTNQKPRIATEQECKAKWGGGKPGEFFRCGLCGYKFKVGDYWRWVYTNNIPSYGGNPMVCESCDGDGVIERWKELLDQWKKDKKGRYWYFTRER